MTAVRLLLLKDLRILARSPALVAALVVYPLVIAALVGLVVRFANDRPRVAYVDLDGLPAELVVGGQRFSVANVLAEVDDDVELLPMSRVEADRELEAGKVVAEIVVPEGFAADLRGMVRSPTLVLKTTSGGLGNRVEQRTQALVYNLNRLLQEAYISANLAYVALIRQGGQGSFLGNEFDIVGLDEAARQLDAIERSAEDPALAARARELSVFVREAELGLRQTETALRATANPIELATEGSRRSWLVSSQVQTNALALTLVFICVLAAATAVAAERDENVIGRLVRGLVGLGGLVAEKIALVTVVALPLGLALAVVFGVAVEVSDVPGGEPWQRLPLLAVGLLLAGAAFGAFGVLLGALAREARTASLLAFLVTLPLVLVGLVPNAAVAAAGWVSDAFPFAHAVGFFEAALFDSSPWTALGREAGWLLGLGGIFAAAARLAVRRLLV